MKKLIASLLLAIPLLSLPVLGETKTEREEKKEITTLSEGTYSAQIKALVCYGCGPLIVKTINKLDYVESVEVDSEPSTLRLTIKKEEQVEVEDLQKSLDKAAKRMGMGADFSLSNLKRIEEKKKQKIIRDGNASDK